MAEKPPPSGASRLADLAPEKQALLTSRLRQQSAGDRLFPLMPAAREGDLPLSFTQLRLWFLDQLDPHQPAYYLSAAWRLTGNLDIETLAESLRLINSRHEMLRTTFGIVNGQPVYQIDPPRPVSLPILDLSELPAVLKQLESVRLTVWEADLPFDLAEGPLMRTKVIRLNLVDHLLVFTLHQIIADSWSMGILARELAITYNSLITGLPSPLPQLLVQYADYAIWQRQHIAGEALDRDLSYWRGRLAEIAPLELPTDRPRSPVPHLRCNQRHFRLEDGLPEALRRLSQDESITSFMALVSGVQVLLLRWTDQHDITIGTLVHGRIMSELEGLIGPLSNYLTLRTDLSDEPSFRALLGRTREVTLDAYAHQNIPFWKIVEEIRPDRDLTRSPLFQVLVTYTTSPALPLVFAGITMEQVSNSEVESPFDLSFHFREADVGLLLDIEYNVSLFDALTIERLLERFSLLLRKVVRYPDDRVSELSLLTDCERAQLLWEWNDTAVAPSNLCIHDLFIAQAMRTPDATALNWGSQRITYRELDCRSNRLARRLRHLGVGPEVVVGICLERSPDLVSAFLAVFKAGGAYVPLDPSLPAERLAYLLEDSGAALLVSTRKLFDRLPNGSPANFWLDNEQELLASFSDIPLESGCDARNLAYIIYTSGSTGRPKGVAIEHRSVAMLISWASENFSSEELSGVLAATTITFDVSVFELYVPLLLGGCVVLAGRLFELSSSDQLSEVTMINTVPVAASYLLELGLPESLKVVNFAGERLPRETADLMFGSGMACRVLNLYGPTEDTVYSTCENLGRGEAEEPAIGRSIRGKSAYIVDRRLNLMPVGSLGELYLGGFGLARGYLGRPDITAERFVPDPFGLAPGARLYRTGDLARRGPDGRIYYVGRSDHQVKIRGFRIEPGEVEAILEMHPQVRQAVVLAIGDQPGEMKLVAYCLAMESPIPAHELRNYLGSRLPVYMVPEVFLELDALPLTANGKVDRRALAALSRTLKGEREEEYVPPSTPVEEVLARIWEETLGVHPVSVHDNFFALGGHSLLAMMVVARVRDGLDVELPMGYLFEAPTIHDFATRIHEARRRAQSSEAQEMAASSKFTRPASTRASFAQERFWLLAAIGSGDASYNVPVFLKLTGQLKITALEMALTNIVHKHEVLRANFLLSNEQLIQRVRPHVRLSIPVVDLVGIPEEGLLTRARAAELLLSREARRKFDLSHDSLLQPMLLRMDHESNILFLLFHHIVIDAWSIDIFVQELEITYGEYLTGRLSPISALPLQYSDFAKRQRRWMEGEESSQQREYWKRRLAGAAELLSSLPADRIRPEVLGSEGSRVVEKVEEALFNKLRGLSRRKGVTLFMALLAAVTAVLRRYTGQEDLVVGTPMANRRWKEAEGIIGVFLNTVVVRNEVKGNVNFENLLDQVRESLLEAFENQDFPFEKLVEELRPGRSLSRSPLFQVLTVHQRSTPGKAGGFVKEVQIGSVGAKFEITFSFLEANSGLVAEIEYNCSLYEESTARRLHGHLMAMLAAMAEGSQVGILDVGLLRHPEFHLLSAEWNDTGAELQGGLVLNRFARHVQRCPSALAVVCGKDSLTYAELNSRSERLARRLVEREVSLEVPVALLVERTPALVIGVLAVLKAGGAYVPLDPETPVERLAGILADLETNSGGLRILAEDALRDQVSSALQIDARNWISFDWECSEQDQPQGRSFLPHPSPQNLAYVLYTSGTAGAPKGVAVAHGNVAAFLDWAEASFSASERRAVLAATPLTFDLSVFELFLPLTTGGCVVMVRDALAFLEDKAVVSLDVSLVNTVPSLMVSLLEAGALPASATVVNLAGEVLRRSVVDGVLRCGTVHRLINLYGPTEATVYATAAAMDLHETREPTLGRPIRNTQVFVVNEMLGLQPIGAPGELVLGGQGVARGYWNLPAMTAERFVPNPFGGPGARLYRTGDLARWLPDGQLEFLGRLDRQVKVRGLRIEPGDIEASLFRHEAVSDAAVTSRVSPQGERQLVAYVKRRENADDSRASDFRVFLQQHLPRGLVPSYFVLVNDIPRTIRGKVDYERLPSPDWGGEEATEFIPPQSFAEKRLAEIWSEVLGITYLSVNDNFFDRGGHSLKAAQVEARLRQIGVSLPLHRIFEKQQLRELAEEIQAEVEEVAAGAEKSLDLWSIATGEEAGELRGGQDLANMTQADGAEISSVLSAIFEEKARALKRRSSLSFPATCTLNVPTTLRFQLVAMTPVDPLLLRLARLHVLQPACTETLFVKVTAPAFRVQPNLARMQISAIGDSDMVAFTMVPLEQGVHVVEVEVFAGADRVGYYILETEAAPYVN